MSETQFKYWELPGFPKDTCGMDHDSDPDHCVTHCGKATEWLTERLAKAERVVEAAKKATCDSHSGLYCDDDSCANKILPVALSEYAATEKKRA